MRACSLITSKFGWLLILAAAGCLVFAVAIASSRFARIRLGPDDSTPEFRRGTWLAMLFAAGMGIGLVFFGVAEPVLHFGAPLDAEPRTVAAAREAMALTFFHWGLHAWAIYAVVGLALAYFCFRRGLPLAPRSALEPLLGERRDGWIGQLVDILAVFGTLLLAVFVLGPTTLLLDSFVDNLGHYLQSLIRRSFRRDGWRGDPADWQANWTLFYWAWWMSWAPFVGTFIARISRGRTIREFVIGVLLVPSGLTFAWLTVFGDTALWLELRAGVDVSAAVAADSSSAIYVVLGALPLGRPLSLVAVLVVVLFFVTSSDSGSLVVDMLTSGGDPNPPIRRRVFWAVAEGTVAAVLLAAGGLEALQAATIATGLPFCLVIVAMATGLALALRRYETAREP